MHVHRIMAFMAQRLGPLPALGCAFASPAKRKNPGRSDAVAHDPGFLVHTFRMSAKCPTGFSGAIKLSAPYRNQSDDQVTNPRKLRDSAFFPNSHCRIGRPCDCPMRSLHMTSPHLGLT